MKILSPLRYPGGKAGFASFLTDIIDLNDLRGCRYYEPYAGGAGAALYLLHSGIVSEICLNDADKRIYSFWRSILHDSDRFVDKISDVPLTIKEWHHQRAICARPRLHTRFDLGFATFYMNRCNRSGVIMKSGPIGGYEQQGKWKLHVRFNREALIERVLNVRKFKDQMNVRNEDAIVFLKKHLPSGRGRKSVFVYLDPPYVNNGQRLYLNSFTEIDHSDLARYISSQRTLNWLMSYDDCDLIRRIYSKQNVSLMSIKYTLQEKRTAQELIITPGRISLPTISHVYGRESLLSVFQKELPA